MAYEVLTASTDHSEDAVREALANSRPDLTVEEIKQIDGTWRILAAIKAAEKPPFLQDKDDDASDDAPSADDAPDDDDDDDAADSKDDADDDKGSDDKGDDKGKSKGDVVSELKDLIGQLNDVLKQVQDKAGEAADETAQHRDKLEEAQKALGDDAPGGDGDTPPPPMPGNGPAPGGKAPFGGGGKPPVPPRSVVPGRPGMPGGGGPGLPTFTNVEVAQHPGVDENGERISLVAAAAQLEFDAEFADYEVIGMVENSDGTYSAKLKRKN